MFLISWRNPDEAQGHFDLDTYADAVLEARQAVADITGQAAVHVNAACSGGIISAGALGHLAAERKPRRRREPHAVRLRAGQRAGGHRGGAREPRDRRRGRGGVGAARLRRRAGARRRVRLAAAQRPRVELRGQQLPAGQGAARLRHPVLEPGRRAPRGRPASRLRPPRARQLADARRRARGPRLAGRPRAGRRRQLHRRRPRTTTSCRGRTPTAAPQLLGGATRFVLSTSGHIQALVNPPAAGSRASYRVADEHPADPQAFLEQAAKVARELVAGLRGVAGRALGRAGPGAQAARRPRAPRARQGPRHLRRLRADAMATSAIPYQHLGEALATDYFLVREQFTDEQWEHFLRTRRFVDEEVLPAINAYWERGGAAVAAVPPARRARSGRRRHRRLRLPGHEPARLRTRPHGGPPRRRQPRHLPRRAGRAGHASRSHLLGSDEQQRALAAGDGPRRRDRRVRADRARPRLGLGRARDRAPAATATSG